MEDFPDLEAYWQIQEIQHTPSKRNTILKCIVFKLLKTNNKEKNNEKSRKDIYRGTKICQKPSRPEDTCSYYIFKILKEKENHQPKFYTSKYIFEEIRLYF